MTFETIFQHLVLKSVSIVLVTPFLCSSYVETVQSCIASESPGVFDSLKEGFLRMMLWKMDRKLPIWLLCGPTLFYYMSHYLISSCVFKISVIVLNDTNAEDSDNVSKFKARYRDIMSGFWGQLVADVMLFPLSTIITRYDTHNDPRPTIMAISKQTLPSGHPNHNRQRGHQRSHSCHLKLRLDRRLFGDYRQRGGKDWTFQRLRSSCGSICYPLLADEVN